MEGSDKSCDKPLVPKHGGKFGRLRRASRTKKEDFVVTNAQHQLRSMNSREIVEPLDEENINNNTPKTAFTSTTCVSYTNTPNTSPESLSTPIYSHCYLCIC